MAGGLQTFASFAAVSIEVKLYNNPHIFSVLRLMRLITTADLFKKVNMDKSATELGIHM